MTFNSLQYAAFLPVVLLIYWRLGRRGQNVLLLLASYLFYGAFDWRFLGLLMLSTATDYTVGRVLEVTEDEGRRKLAFLASLAVNLGILGVFKYFDFFVTEASRFLDRVGLHANPPLLHVLLPVGISFYTFHGISYAFDVYRKQIRPTHDLLAFAVFVSFFPQLVAGPIGRAHLQLPQFERDRVRPNADEVRSALTLILVGLFKKIVIADAAAPYVNAAFTQPGSHGAVTLLLGMYGFAFQIYGDFSGYSDIARGSARLLGVDLPLNFDRPYLSRSITEFWRRWHISLSTWLRDYLYVPLGGNRGTAFTVYRNLILTMLIGGLWHGAAMTFVIWGGLHGVLLALERAFLSAEATDASRPYVLRRDLIQTVLTFHVVCVGWVFFRAPSFSAALDYLKGIARLRPGSVDSNALAVIAFVAVAALLIDIVQRRANDEGPILTWSPVARGLLIGTLVVAIVAFSGGAPTPFIYFQF
jgi:D-alanyl-lipoteichoic acid acyltransferase DltB (MBOAT superfamily)